MDLEVSALTKMWVCVPLGPVWILFSDVDFIFSRWGNEIGSECDSEPWEWKCWKHRNHRAEGMLILLDSIKLNTEQSLTPLISHIITHKGKNIQRSKQGHLKSTSNANFDLIGVVSMIFFMWHKKIKHVTAANKYTVRGIFFFWI